MEKRSVTRHVEVQKKDKITQVVNYFKWVRICFSESWSPYCDVKFEAGDGRTELSNIHICNFWIWRGSCVIKLLLPQRSMEQRKWCWVAAAIPARSYGIEVSKKYMWIDQGKTKRCGAACVWQKYKSKYKCASPPKLLNEIGLNAPWVLYYHCFCSSPMSFSNEKKLCF